MAKMTKQPAWLQDVSTPAYVVNEKALLHNLEVLKGVQDRTGCSILLAQKAFSMYTCYPLIAKYLKGAAASGLLKPAWHMRSFKARITYLTQLFRIKSFLNYCNTAIISYSIRQPSGKNLKLGLWQPIKNVACASILSIQHRSMLFMIRVLHCLG